MAMQRELKQNNTFLDIWNTLSLSQKNIIYKLGQSGWQLDYLAFDHNLRCAKIIHYNGRYGRVNFMGEVEFDD